MDEVHTVMYKTGLEKAVGIHRREYLSVTKPERLGQEEKDAVLAQLDEVALTSIMVRLDPSCYPSDTTPEEVTATQDGTTLAFGPVAGHSALVALEKVVAAWVRLRSIAGFTMNADTESLERKIPEVGAVC